MNENKNVTHHQQDGGILDENGIENWYGRAYDSSVPADGREEVQSNITL